MSESRVSSVIQEWAYPGQAHPQTHTPAPSSHEGSSNQLPQIDMIPYGPSQGLVRGGADDRVAEQMMALSYQPYTSSCLRTPNGGGPHQQQHHSSSQQVKIPRLPSESPLALLRYRPHADFLVFPTSRTSPCSFFRP